MKNLGVKPVDGIVNPVALDDVILPRTINTASLGGLVLSLIDNSDALLCIVVDVANRRVRAKAAVAATPTNWVATLMGAAAEGDGSVRFAKSDAAKRTSPWDMLGEDGLPADPFTVGGGAGSILQDPLKPAQPSYSSGGIVGVFEDATLKVGGALEAHALLIVLDQGTGIVTVCGIQDAVGAGEAVDALVGKTIAYDQIPGTTGSDSREPLG